MQNCAISRREIVIKRSSSFSFSAWLVRSPLRDRTVHNVQSPSLKASDDEFLKKITDLRDYCMKSASDWINVRRINSVILCRK